MAEGLTVLLVILPVVLAGIAHSVAIRFNLLASLARPLDFGLCLHGKPLLGSNKTFRGPLIMVSITAVSAWALSLGHSADWLPQGYGYMTEPGTAFVLGAVMGLGYALGELPNSLIKRRLGIAPGSRPGGVTGVICYVCDQVDSVAGAVALLWLIYAPGKNVLLALLVVGSLVHVVFDQCLYLFGVKRRDTLRAGEVGT